MFRKNTAGQFLLFQLVNATTGAGLTGATVSVRRCIDGTFAAATGTVTEDTGGGSSAGFYKLALSQADTNGNNIGFAFTATSAIPVALNIVTTAGDPTDSVRFGLTALPNAAAEAAGGLYTRGTGAGQINQDANGRIDANVKTWISGTIPAVNVTGVPLVDAKYLLGTIFSTPATAGLMDVNAKQWNGLTTVELPLVPTTAGRKLDVSVGGEAGVDWANVGSPTTAVDLSNTTIKTTQKVDVETIKTNPVVNAGTITFPTGATLASTTNITAGTITTATALGAAYDAAKTAASQTSVDDIPTNAELATALASADDVTLAAIASLNNISAAGVRAAVGLASANLDTQLDALPTNAELTAALGTADDAVLTQVALVKAKTDQLTFSKANELDSNIQSVNDVTIIGNGSGTPFQV